MSFRDPRSPVDEFGGLVAKLREIETRLERLATPSGSSLARTVQVLGETVATLDGLVNNIQEQLDEYIANDAYTKAQVDALVAAPPAVAVTGDLSAGGAFRAPDAVAFNITSTRRTAWLQDSDGRLGYAPSSERFKQDVKPAGIEPHRVLAVEPVAFRYREQVELHGDEAPFELGFIAEHLDALGLREFVYYDAEGRPEGIEYSAFVVAQQAALRHLARRVLELEGGTE